MRKFLILVFLLSSLSLSTSLINTNGVKTYATFQSEPFSVEQVCMDSVSHNVVVNWDVTGLGVTDEAKFQLKIDLTLPDGSVITHSTSIVQGSQEIAVNHPDGGDAVLGLTFLFVDMEDFSNSFIVHLEPCSEQPIGPLPDLVVNKTNDVEGQTSVGQKFRWIIEIQNQGEGVASFPSDSRVFRDQLPFEEENVTLATYQVLEIPNGLSCDIGNSENNASPGELLCLGSISLGSGESVRIVVEVTPRVAMALVNPPNGICFVDLIDPEFPESNPNGRIEESNEGNNQCSDTVIVSESPRSTDGPLSDLVAIKSNSVSGELVLGESFVWTVLIVNQGQGEAFFPSQSVLLRDQLPRGSEPPTYANLMSVTSGGVSAGVECTFEFENATDNTTAREFNCQAAGGEIVIPPGGTIEVSFEVTPSGSGDLLNGGSTGVCLVDPRDVVDESDDGNNPCSDLVRVKEPLSDLVARKSNNVDGVADVNTTFTWTIQVENIGAGKAEFSPNAELFKDDLPSDGSPMYVIDNVTTSEISGNVNCSLGGPGNDLLTCFAGSSMTTISPGGNFEVTLSVTPTSVPGGNAVNPGFLTNGNPEGDCRADPSSTVEESNEQNNDCADLVRIIIPCPIVATTATSLIQGGSESNTGVTHIQEQTMVTLDEDLPIDLSPDSASMIDAGTEIQSQLIHFDPVGQPRGFVNLNCTLRFDHKILGIQTSSGNLNSSDDTLGLDNEGFYPGGDRGLENNDRVIIINNRTIEVRFGVTGSVDQIRVIKVP